MCVRDFMDAVIKEQPAVPRQHGGRSAANLEPFPGGDGTGQAMMRTKMTKAMRFPAFNRRRTIGNPNAFAVQINWSSRRSFGRLIGVGSGKQRAMDHRHGWFSSGVWNGRRKNQGVLIIDPIKVKAPVRMEARQPDTLPVE